jgi:hypothetical protein
VAFDVLLCKGILTGEIAIPRFPIEWIEEVTWCGIGARGHRSSGFGDLWGE